MTIKKEKPGMLEVTRAVRTVDCGRSMGMLVKNGLMKRGVGMLEEKDLQMIAEIVGKTVEPISKDVKELKGDVAGVKSDVAGLKEDVAGLKGEVVEIKGDVAGLKWNVCELEQKFEGTVELMRKDIKELQLTLENETNRNIRIIAEVALSVVTARYSV